MRRWLWLALLGLVTVAARLALVAPPLPAPVEAAPVPSRVSALARLDPASRVVRLQASSARQQDRVLRWLVQEGQDIRQGQLLAVLDGEPVLEAARDQARARARQAEARLGQVLAGPKQGEVDRQRAEIRRLESERARQRAILAEQAARWRSEERQLSHNLERFRRLYGEGATTALEVEQRQLTWETALRQQRQVEQEAARSGETLDAQIAAARAELDRIQEIRPMDVAAARADLEAAQAEVQRAEVELAQCRLRSPLTGRVLAIRTRVGERISSQGLAELGSTGQMMAVAEVHQADIRRLRLGQTCELKSQAFERPLTGRIASFGQQVQRQNVFGEQPGEQFDQRVVEVRVALDPASSRLARSFTNLQLEATFAP